MKFIILDWFASHANWTDVLYFEMRSWCNRTGTLIQPQHWDGYETQIILLVPKSCEYWASITSCSSQPQSRIPFSFIQNDKRLQPASLHAPKGKIKKIFIGSHQRYNNFVIQTLNFVRWFPYSTLYQLVDSLGKALTSSPPANITFWKLWRLAKLMMTLFTQLIITIKQECLLLVHCILFHFGGSSIGRGKVRKKLSIKMCLHIRNVLLPYSVDRNVVFNEMQSIHIKRQQIQ